MTASEMLTTLRDALALDDIDSTLRDSDEPVLLLEPDAVGPKEREVMMEISVLPIADDKLHMQILSILTDTLSDAQTALLTPAMNRLNLSAFCGSYILLPDGSLAHRQVIPSSPDRCLEAIAAALEASLETLSADIEEIYSILRL